MYIKNIIITAVVALTIATATAAMQTQPWWWGRCVCIEENICPTNGVVQTWDRDVEFDVWRLVDIIPYEESSWYSLSQAGLDEGTRAFLMVDSNGYAVSACILDDEKRNSLADKVHGFSSIPLGTNEFTEAEARQLVRQVRSKLPKLYGSVVLVR